MWRDGRAEAGLTGSCVAVGRHTGPCRLTATQAVPSATLSGHAQSKAVNLRALQAPAPAQVDAVRGTWGVVVAAALVVFCAQGTHAHYAACQQRQAVEVQGVWLTLPTKVVFVEGGRTPTVREELTFRSTLCAALRSAPDARSSLSKRAVRHAARATRDSSTSAQPGVRISVRLHTFGNSAGVRELAAARRRANAGRSAPVLCIVEAPGNSDPAAGEPVHTNKHLKVKGCHMMGTRCSSACWHAENSVKHRVNKVTYGQST